MPHKLDRMRHKRDVRNRTRRLKARYMKLTSNDSVAPEKALAGLKDGTQVDLAKRLGRQLAARGVYTRFAGDR